MPGINPAPNISEIQLALSVTGRGFTVTHSFVFGREPQQKREASHLTTC